jgi:hypothetical protein
VRSTIASTTKSGVKYEPLLCRAVARHERQRAVALAEPVLQEALVDRAHVAHREVAVVHGLAIHAIEAVEGGGEQPVGHRASLEPGVASGREEAAVVLRDAEGRLARVDHPEERAQIVVEVVRARGEHPAPVDVGREPRALAPQAVVEVVRIGDREQFPGLRVQAEEQPVEQHEGVVERGAERLGRPFLLAEQSLRDERDRGEDLLLERAPDPDGARVALGQDTVQEGSPVRVPSEGRRGEERREVPEEGGVRVLDERDEVNLEGRPLQQVAVGRVEPPQAAVGQDAPSAAGDEHVVDDLPDGVLGVAAAPAGVERPVEPLGVGDRDGVPVPPSGVGELGIRPHGVVQEQRVVGLPSPASGPQAGLHREGEAQPLEDRLDEALLRLRLVGGREAGPLGLPERSEVGQHRGCVQVGEARHVAEPLLQEVVREELEVGEGPERELELARARRHPADQSNSRSWSGRPARLGGPANAMRCS